MGETAAQTVGEIEQTRDRLDRDLRELEQQMPPVKWVKRAAGVVVGGGVLATVIRFLLKRRKKSKQKRIERMAVPVQVELIPRAWQDRLAEQAESGRWRPWAASVGAAWILFRLAELRQLRRIARSRTPG